MLGKGGRGCWIRWVFLRGAGRYLEKREVQEPRMSKRQPGVEGRRWEQRSSHREKSVEEVSMADVDCKGRCRG